MRQLLLVGATVAALAVVIAVWAMSGPEPKAPAYRIEVRDVAGIPGLVVAPAVVAAAPRQMMPEVLVKANVMPEVVVSATRLAADVAASGRADRPITVN